jgi:hypothetical protein
VKLPFLGRSGSRISRAEQGFFRKACKGRYLFAGLHFLFLKRASASEPNRQRIVRASIRCVSSCCQPVEWVRLVKIWASLVQSFVCDDMLLLLEDWSEF